MEFLQCELFNLLLIFSENSPIKPSFFLNYLNFRSEFLRNTDVFQRFVKKTFFFSIETSLISSFLKAFFAKKSDIDEDLMKIMKVFVNNSEFYRIVICKFIENPEKIDEIMMNLSVKTIEKPKFFFVLSCLRQSCEDLSKIFEFFGENNNVFRFYEENPVLWDKNCDNLLYEEEDMIKSEENMIKNEENLIKNEISIKNEENTIKTEENNEEVTKDYMKISFGIDLLGIFKEKKENYNSPLKKSTLKKTFKFRMVSEEAFHSNSAFFHKKLIKSNENCDILRKEILSIFSKENCEEIREISIEMLIFLNKNEFFMMFLPNQARISRFLKVILIILLNMTKNSFWIFENDVFFEILFNFLDNQQKTQEILKKSEIFCEIEKNKLLILEILWTTIWNLLKNRGNSINLAENYMIICRNNLNESDFLCVSMKIIENFIQVNFCEEFENSVKFLIFLLKKRHFFLLNYLK